MPPHPPRWLMAGLGLASSLAIFGRQARQVDGGCHRHSRLTWSCCCRSSVTYATTCPYTLAYTGYDSAREVRWPLVTKHLNIHRRYLLTVVWCDDLKSTLSFVWALSFVPECVFAGCSCYVFHILMSLSRVGTPFSEYLWHIFLGFYCCAHLLWVRFGVSLYMNI